MEQKIIYLGIEHLHPHPKNPRTTMAQEGLEELSASIRVNGILQNLTVVPAPELGDGEYTIIIGHRRLAAAKMAGIESVPCVIREMDEPTQIRTMAMENMQRTDLTPLEEAKVCQLMMDLGDSVEEVAGKTGFSTGTIRNRLKILKLDEDKVRDAQERGVPMMQMLEAADLKDPADREKVLAAAGTNNFYSALKSAQDKEAEMAKWDSLLEVVKTFAAPAGKDTSELVRHDYMTSPKSPKKYKIPEDAADPSMAKAPKGKLRYFYSFYDGGYYRNLTIYREKTAADETEDAEKRAAQDKRNENSEKASALNRHMFELRSAFVKKVPKTKATKAMPYVTSILAYYITKDCAYYGNDKLRGIGEAILSNAGEVVPSVVEAIAENAGAWAKLNPERALFFMAVKVLENQVSKGWNRDDMGYVTINQSSLAHQDQPALDELYALLEKVGYEMSDEEKALQDGTHEVFCDNTVEDASAPAASAPAETEPAVSEAAPVDADAAPFNVDVDDLFRAVLKDATGALKPREDFGADFTYNGENGVYVSTPDSLEVHFGEKIYSRTWTELEDKGFVHDSEAEATALEPDAEATPVPVQSNEDDEDLELLVDDDEDEDDELLLEEDDDEEDYVDLPAAGDADENGEDYVGRNPMTVGAEDMKQADYEADSATSVDSNAAPTESPDDQIAREDIDGVLLAMNKESRMKIAEFLSAGQSKSEQIAMLRRTYGQGGTYPAYGNVNATYTIGGMRLSKGKLTAPTAETFLPWGKVATEIRRLMTTGRYVQVEKTAPVVEPAPVIEPAPAPAPAVQPVEGISIIGAGPIGNDDIAAALRFPFAYADGSPRKDVLFSVMRQLGSGSTNAEVAENLKRVFSTMQLVQLTEMNLNIVYSPIGIMLGRPNSDLANRKMEWNEAVLRIRTLVDAWEYIPAADIPAYQDWTRQAPENYVPDFTAVHTPMPAAANIASDDGDWTYEEEPQEYPWD